MVNNNLVHRSQKPVNTHISTLSRRKFLQFGIYGLTASALWLLPSYQQANAASRLVLPTDARQGNFQWPSDLFGNEDFIGDDVVLTVDDCVLSDQVYTLFNLLKARGLSATFFPNSQFIPLERRMIDIWEEIYHSDCDIGYHTTNHRESWTVDNLTADFASYLQYMKQLVEDEHYTAHFVRPPYGAWTKNWMEWVNLNHLTNVRWNYVPSHYSADLSYYQSIRRAASGGNIILIHPRKWDIHWLMTNIDKLQKLAEDQGGTITSLSKLTHFKTAAFDADFF